MFGLRKTLGSLFGLHPIDESWFEQLEETLLKADVGIATTNVLIASLRKLAKSQLIQNAEDLKGLLVQEISRLLAPLENPQNPLLLSQSNHKPEIWLIVGVNGAGKTTSIGKLCHHFQVQGKSVLLAAGDTFRAAARNQLKEWGERNHVQVLSQESGDAAAVAHDAIHAAISRQIDVLFIDTAGRLATQGNLMEELKKVKRVISKVVPDAPHQIVLVLDGNTGQNGIAQVLAFRNAIGLQGIIVTKLDGTAKGGVICALSKALETPPETGTPAFKTFVYALGKGEGLSDLEPFNAEAYAKELVE
ncbi:MAG: signal recognition particle-docking protein FtsY [Burkholderiaceae bacterium]|jgi:fused signal recognition particle receptor|nr:signal recognition particle-docking protein FtsY [Burkholderiaceae bacterium]NDB22586.1 signal recognition particle-docking protein FtsY [Burkholderiaceae bacterium]NDF20667.1 signal recognition particle-docking protein FtsY [Burkholderiaceae bacterium]NDG90215.1 signal recognition particle-docking protein FtsY [Burkholderiaceae bacterium]